MNVLRKIRNGYKGLFWTLAQKFDEKDPHPNEYELKARYWLHWLKDLILSPVYLIMYICAAIIGLTDTSIPKRTLYVQGEHEVDRRFKRYLKNRLIDQ